MLTRMERDQAIERYGAGPAVIAKAWSQVPDPARFWKPSATAWSAHQIIIHCADSEIFAATRIRLLALGSQPVIMGYDQDRAVGVFDYDDLSSELAFATIRAVRAGTLAVIRNMTDDQWMAGGTHSETGPYSASDWLRTYAAHLHDHARQIDENVRLWRNQQESSQ